MFFKIYVLDVYLIIKARQRNLVDFTNSYSMMFILNPIHRMVKYFLIQQNIFIFNTFFFHSLLFYAHYYRLPNMNIFFESIRQFL